MSNYGSGKKHRRKKFKDFKYAIGLLFLIVAVLLVFKDKIPLDFLSGYKIDNENKNGSKSIVDSKPDTIPDYKDKDEIELNGGKPTFNKWDLKNIKGEKYGELDLLGRCQTAYAMLDRSMMPKGERGQIGRIKPTGWYQEKYEGLVNSRPPYLYNRCHLIAYALTGQNANEKNLITGTRYMNATTMLPWEEKVMKYLDNSTNHVLYRVSPYFKENEMLARGVELEAYSVEDEGRGLCFNVFVYNIQPGVELDYGTGKNRRRS